MVSETHAADLREQPTAVAKPPKVKLGPMARGEARLAFGMLAPTFAIVLAIVLFPLLANFWISFKPVQLADLRPPTPVASERMRGEPAAAGDQVLIQYRLRNSSQKSRISDVVLADTLPTGLEPVEVDQRCDLAGLSLTCDLGTWEPGFRERMEMRFAVTDAYLANPISARDSRPVLTGDSENVLTSFRFTLSNFQRAFNASEFRSCCA